MQGVKKIQGQTSGGPDRYRLLLSDGRHSVSCEWDIAPL